MPNTTVNDQLRLAGRTAIVTGAGRGIGSAIAKPTDMGIKSDVVEMVGFAVETYGSLDILVSNAQSSGTRDQPTGLPVPAPLESFDDAELDWTFDTGFRGTFWAVQAAFPAHARARRPVHQLRVRVRHDRERRDRRVQHHPEAVRSLTRTAALEWGRCAITVNVVPPTATDAADNIERADPEAMAAAIAAVPARRLGDPPLDIAPAVLFLATDDGRYITGQTLGADGGFVSAGLTRRPLRATPISR
jgi:NAD(P)-dependent dehydrogenase (short-subunit alcohol dehydrogenase family)